MIGNEPTWNWACQGLDFGCKQFWHHDPRDRPESDGKGQNVNGQTCHRKPRNFDRLSIIRLQNPVEKKPLCEPLYSWGTQIWVFTKNKIIKNGQMGFIICWTTFGWWMVVVDRWLLLRDSFSTNFMANWSFNYTNNIICYNKPRL